MRVKDYKDFNEAEKKEFHKSIDMKRDKEAVIEEDRKLKWTGHEYYNHGDIMYPEIDEMKRKADDNKTDQLLEKFMFA